MLVTEVYTVFFSGVKESIVHRLREWRKACEESSIVFIRTSQKQVHLLV